MKWFLIAAVLVVLPATAHDYEKREADGWSVGASGNVRFGLSVYF